VTFEFASRQIYAANYFKYHMAGPNTLPSDLLYLNQAGVQHLICNLTDAQAYTL
jgi:hypothetical protein